MNAYLMLLKEKGISWFLCRGLYSLKLKGMRLYPPLEKVFEKTIPNVTRLDFFSYDPVRIKNYLIKLPETKKSEIIHAADNACNGIIEGFSSVELNYGNPIHWQENPLTGRSCDASLKWYCIPDFDKERGDIKVIWEISRFTHFFILARAFLITDNVRYAKAYFDQISEWVQNNVYSYGANYKCGQECSLRLISCLFTYPVFASLAKDTDIENIKTIVDGSYKKVLSNFFYAHRCIKNNHTISELVGMIIGAWCCTDTKRLKYAYKTLDKVIEEQFSADGGYIQLSFNYQRLALQDLEIVLSASKITGMNLSETSKERIRSSVLLLYQCLDESGDVPNYGSNDGALILPLTTGGYRDYKPVINTTHLLLEGRPLFEDSYLKEEILWFGLDTSNKPKKVEKVSSDFPQAGVSTFRSDKSWLMVLCKKKIGQMDNGHIDLWIKGHNVLCDAGSYSYASDLGKELYTARSHNTAYCEGIDQIRRIGAFAGYGQPILKKRLWSEKKIELDIQYSTGYEHKRTVVVTNNGYEIDDEVLSENDCYIQFHVLGYVHQIDDSSVLIEGCILKFDAPVRLSKSTRSLYYLKAEDTTCISVPCHRTLHTIIELQEDN